VNAFPNLRVHESCLTSSTAVSVYTGRYRYFRGGLLAEIFLNTDKHGTAVDNHDRDAAVDAFSAAHFVVSVFIDVEPLRRFLKLNAVRSSSMAVCARSRLACPLKAPLMNEAAYTAAFFYGIYNSCRRRGCLLAIHRG